MSVDRERYPFRRSGRWHLIGLVDVILDRISGQNRSQIFPQAVQNILIVRLDHIGDLICSLPALPILKRRFPNAKITLLAGEEGKAILAGNPFVDRLILFSPNWFSRRRLVNPIQFFKLIFELRKVRYDLGFDLRGDLRNILLMTLAGVRYRVGYGIAGGAGLLHKVPVYDPALHQVELNLKLVSDETISRKNVKPEVYLTSEEREKAFGKLKAFGVQKGVRLVAIHPEAGYPSKEWEESKFKEVIEKLLTNSQSQILIFGLSERARKIAQHEFTFLSHPNPRPEGEGGVRGQDRVIDLVGKLSLREMIVILSYCHLFLGNDSGPSHLAQALGIPVVVVSSGTNKYEKWGVWTENSRILKHGVLCSPCYLRYCNVEGHPCMSQISSDDVWQAAQELVSVGKS